MEKNVQVRDPLYNYIEITRVERAIIDTPAFQRLRFVLQNSTAYLTYPANTNSRFLHSLGVMHLSGVMFMRAIQSAGSETLQKFLDKCKMLIVESTSGLLADTKKVIQGWRECLGNASGFYHRPMGSALNVSSNDLFVINMIWQAVRLCALIHDLGHLPLSHLFEEALQEFDRSSSGLPKKNASVLRDEDDRRLKDFKAKLPLEVVSELDGHAGKGTIQPKVSIAKQNKATVERAPHEIKGLMLVEELRIDLGNVEATQQFSNVALRLAKLIFMVNTRPSALNVEDKLAPLRCLHTIVAGDLDADRLDYCVRDPQASGLELGAIDVNRIIDSLVLHEDKNGFRILPRMRAISAIESFFHQRYQIYRNLVYHHSVVRMNGIVKEIIVRLLSENTKENGDEGILDIMDQFGFWTKKPINSYYILAGPVEQYEDAWLRTLLAKVFRFLDDKIKGSEEDACNASPDSRELWVLLDTFLHRRSRNIFSLWKREADYGPTLEKIKSAVPKVRQELLVVPTHGVDFKKHVIDPLRKKLKAVGVVLIHEFLDPKIFKKSTGTDSDELAVLTEGDRPEIQPISRCSPYLESLQAVAARVPNVHLSFVGEKIRENATKMKKCQKLAVKQLIEYATQEGRYGRRSKRKNR